MENGNEGDEIILLALRQIESPINESINSVGQLTPDHIVDIVARSLGLISEGELKVCLIFFFVCVKFLATCPNGIETSYFMLENESAPRNFIR